MKAHFSSDVDALVLFEVAVEILGSRVFRFEFFPDFIEYLGVFLPRDGHDGREIIVAVLFGVIVGFAHPLPVANETAFLPFGKGGIGL